jgi:hypothetical protein
MSTLQKLFFILNKEMERPVYTDSLVDEYRTFFSANLARLGSGAGICLNASRNHKLVVVPLQHGPGSIYCSWMFNDTFLASTFIILGLDDSTDYDVLTGVAGAGETELPEACRAVRSSVRPAVLTVLFNTEVAGISPIMEASLGMAEAMMAATNDPKTREALGDDNRQPEKAFNVREICDDGESPTWLPITWSVISQTMGPFLSFAESFKRVISESPSSFKMVWKIGIIEAEIEGAVYGSVNALMSINSAKGGRDDLVLLSGLDSNTDVVLVDFIRKQIRAIRGAQSESFDHEIESILSSPRPLSVVLSKKGSMADGGMALHAVQNIIAAVFFQWCGVI